MTRAIGYYVHHHGAGHRARAAIVAGAAGGRVTLLGTGLAGKVGPHRSVELPDDRLESTFDGKDATAERPAALHYAPLDHDGIRRRVAAITRWIAEARPAVMVIDVSCEVAMLARLASVATVYVRLGGVRDDVPHREAFRGAAMLVSPFAQALDAPDTAGWVREKTLYCPGLVERPAIRAVEPGSVLVVVGQGGMASDGAAWVRAARATPDRRWTVIGQCSGPDELPGNLTLAGWVDDAPRRIAEAEIVVGSAGDGVVGAVLAAARPFICMPEARPFDEQRCKAASLVAAGAAVLCEQAESADWAALIAQAHQLWPEHSAALDDPAGAARLADHLLALADRTTRS
ncbi:glycosyltransferase [Sphingomonas sp. RB3P16]|uniref:glycosyltransferase n=1 Tax=Parasphingomonas frigoris TaxID=3096163 RepID=UPI002FC74744